MLKKNLEQRTWDEFRQTGLFMFVNTILHAFGWALTVSVEDGKVIECYPSRTKFRGFGVEDTDEMHLKIADYLAENSKDFPKEIND